jgi:hypothetical protein
MRSLFRWLMTLLVVSSAFYLGFHFGKEKEKAKIPKFQEDLDRSA